MPEVRVEEELIVHAENRVGLVAEVGRVLSERGISILAINAEVEGAGAAVHLITDAQSYARDALRKAAFEVSLREVVVLTLPNHPGYLSKVTEALARREIDIEELYATVPGESTKGVVVFTCSNNGKAALMFKER